MPLTVSVHPLDEVFGGVVFKGWLVVLYALADKVTLCAVAYIPSVVMARLSASWAVLLVWAVKRGKAFPCLQPLTAFSVTPSSGDTPQRPGANAPVLSRSRVPGFCFGAPALRRVDLFGSAYAGCRRRPKVAGRHGPLRSLCSRVVPPRFRAPYGRLPVAVGLRRERI